MLYRKIDITTGLFIEDVIMDENPNPNVYIEAPCPEGLYHPKWENGTWTEGGTPPEPVIQEPTIEERLKAAEDALLFLMGSV
jgi:hypothetical protein